MQSMKIDKQEKTFSLSRFIQWEKFGTFGVITMGKIFHPSTALLGNNRILNYFLSQNLLRIYKNGKMKKNFRT